MAQDFHYSTFRRIVNRILVFLLRYDLAPKIYYLLTVKGRRTGRPHSVPVVLIEEGSKRWLVAPYGVVDWVKNARVAGRVTLSRGRVSMDFASHELSPEVGAPILKMYVNKFPLTKSYFNANLADPLSEFLKDAGTRPVFELHPI